MNASLVKEVRALLPIWIACLVTIAAGSQQSRGVLVELAVAAFVIGPALLAGQAVGQEFSYRTLSMLLAQPIDRRRMFVLKWCVAAAMAAVLEALSWAVLNGHARGMWELWIVRILPLAGGLLLAPPITLLLRNTLGGVLATATLFSFTLLVPTVALTLARDIAPDTAQDIVLRPWAITMITLSAIGAALMFPLFSRLESGDFSPRAFTLPRFGSATARRFRPIAALAAKEVYLQQLSLSLAAICVAAAIVLLMLQRTVESWAYRPIAGLMSLYCVTLSLVIGAMASAEERQLGVAEWQQIQPVSTLTQWLVKITVSEGLSVMLAVLLPSLLIRLAVNPELDWAWQVLLLPAVFLTAAGIYLSSLTNAGTWALVLALPSGVAALLFISVLDAGPMAVTGRPFTPIAPIKPIAIALIPVLLYFAYGNHTRPQRRGVTVLAQIVAIAVVIGMTRFVALSL